MAQVAKTKQIVIVSGGAKGADTLGEQYAKNRDYEIKRFIPDWDRLGKKAGYIRNQAMADYAQALIAFYDGASKGTGHMINIAKKQNLMVRVICY